MAEAESAHLLAAARASWPRAYAPYSGFRVGAALAAPDGAVAAGANVENVCYPVGLCAEAAALGALVAAGQRAVTAVAVVAETGFCPPCGACRQRLAEFAGSATPVYLPDAGGTVYTYRLGDLLPEAFGSASLGGGDA